MRSLLPIDDEARNRIFFFWHENIIYDFNGLCVLKCKGGLQMCGCWSHAKTDLNKK